ncbi:MAG: DNA replication/repair protein RecF [Chloroflexota bacterium]
MRITHLSLTNFRNYGRLEIDLPSGATLLHGNNAQGKTNLLEAIYYLATTRSPHISQDHQLIHWDALHYDDPIVAARLQARVATRQGERLLEMRLISEKKSSLAPRTFRREALVNRRKVRLMDLLGQIRVVLFLPQDVQLVTGPPNQRRRYLNITLCQIDPVYCRLLSNYNKVLEQRNATLRQLADGQSNRDVLTIFSEKCIDLGSEILARRARFFQKIAREAQHIHYEKLTDRQESIRLRYLPRLQDIGGGNDEMKLAELGDWLETNMSDMDAIRQQYREAMATYLTKDMARGSTTIGPHRDDWLFWVNGRQLSLFGSRGQQRSAILALKMAEIHWMTQETGESPILLLDEVVAELDERRRALLLDTVQHAQQAMLTATDKTMFSTQFLQNASTLQVENGRIRPSSLSA